MQNIIFIIENIQVYRKRPALLLAEFVKEPADFDTRYSEL